MKVDGSNPWPPDSSPECVRDPNRRSATGVRHRPVAGRDEARLLYDENRIRALVSQTMALPEIRQERVAALRRAIQEGRYHVSDEQVADALLSEHLARERSNS